MFGESTLGVGRVGHDGDTLVRVWIGHHSFLVGWQGLSVGSLVGDGAGLCYSGLLVIYHELDLLLSICKVSLKRNLFKPVLLILINHIKVTVACLS